MTEFEIASAIENHVTSSQGVTDFAMEMDQIRDEVDTLRIRFLEEMDLASTLMPPFEGYIQRIQLTVKKESGRQSYVEIPRLFFTFMNKAAISWIGSTTYKTSYRRIYGNQNISFSHDSVGKIKDPTAWIRQEEIWFYNISPDVVQLDAIFQDPSDVPGYDFEQDEYPIPGGMADRIIGKTAQTIITSHYRIFPQPNTQSDIPVQTDGKRR